MYWLSWFALFVLSFVFPFQFYYYFRYHHHHYLFFTILLCKILMLFATL